MEPRKVIILTQRDDGVWFDSTDRICDMYYESGFYHIMFFGNGNYFTYRTSKVCVDRKPKRISLVAVRTKDKVYKGFQEAISFEKANRIKLFYEDFAVSLDVGECEIIKDALKTDKNAKGILGYYSHLVDLIAARDENQQYLQRIYERLDPLPNNVVLSNYLTGKNSKNSLGTNPYFPFSFNESQHEAINKIFTNKLSVVEGPPGTGKTQTILNIISTAIINKMSVAVVSSNNSAIANVKEKLEARGYGSLVAMLGNSTNVETFFETLPDNKLPTLKKINLNDSYLGLLNKKNHLDSLKSNINKLRIELDNLQKEKDRFCVEYPLNERLSKYGSKLTKEQATEALLALEDKGKKDGFFNRLFFWLKYKMPMKVYKSLELDELINHFKHAYYEIKLSDLKRKYEEDNKAIEELSRRNLDQAIQAYSERKFQDSILDLRKSSKTNDKDFNQQNYKCYFVDFVKRYPVILSSTFSLPKCTASDYEYDLLIMDESSQVSLVGAIPALAKAKRVVFLGDNEQLSEIDEEVITKNEPTLASKYQIPNAYRAANNNILKSVKSVFKKDIPCILLNEHYRCQKEIISFSNKRFYNNKLVCFTKDDGRENHLKVIKTVPGNHARRNVNGTGLYNDREIAEILKLIEEIPSTESIAVITPYRHQANLLQSQVPQNVQVDTIHKFQGRESDVVIFSTVANSSDDYVKDDEVIHSFVNQDDLINVAMTRAKHEFILVTSDKIYSQSKGCLGDLVKYLKYETKADIKEGEVKSVFDILYDDYNKARIEYLEKRNKSEDIITETLINELIEKLLRDKQYNSLMARRHVCLKELIKIDETIFDNEELKYLKHPWTHIDFAVCNIFDKKPVLLIEVDGVSYHEQSDRQSLHDAIKDKAVSQSGLQLLRLKTNGNSEEIIIRTELDKVI